MNSMQNEIPESAATHPTDAADALGAHATQQHCGCAFEPIRQALHQGAQDARAAATAAVPRVKHLLAEAARQVAYGTAYAVAFQVTLARLACPEVIKDGSRRGYEAGTSAAREWVEMGSQRQTRSGGMNPGVGSVSGAMQPGLA